MTWVPPDLTDRNGILRNYKISYISAGKQVESSNEMKVTVNQRTRYTLTGLIPFTNYSIRIAASTSVGFGPYSPASIYQTDKAGNINRIQSSKSLKFSLDS